MAFKEKLNTFLGNDPEPMTGSVDNVNEFYKDTFKQTNKGSSKMILLEPRAFSEAQTIADYIKSRNTVVVNLKRVTPEIAKRIVDFLSGAVYALNGDLQKLGNGIFLCTPNNVDIEGKIQDNDKSVKKDKKETEDEFDW